jgi:hypothetical protein
MLTLFVLTAIVTALCSAWFAAHKARACYRRNRLAIEHVLDQVSLYLVSSRPI